MVYACKQVLELQEFYRGAMPQDFSTTVELVEEHSQRLLAAHQAGDPVCVCQIRNWHPQLVSKPPEEVLAAEFDLGDARNTIMREFGFVRGDGTVGGAMVSMVRLPEAFDHDFGLAVDLALAGNTTELRAMLEKRPKLATQRSAFGHGATLLIYLGSNGVEMWRQVVPDNIVEVAELLITHGADRRATMPVYGGEFDALALAETSAHPREAGVLDNLVKVLK